MRSTYCQMLPTYVKNKVELRLRNRVFDARNDVQKCLCCVGSSSAIVISESVVRERLGKNKSSRQLKFIGSSIT
jgi:hypothetical protein